MNSTIESWVVEIASQLDLPAKQKAAVILELHTHLHADFSEHIRRGLSEADATRESLAEMGEAESVAGELNHLYRFEGSLARSFLGVLIMLAGYFLIFFMKEGVQAYARYARVEIESGRRAPWWMDLSRLVADSALGERLFFLLPLAGVAFIVGYIARKRAWRCVLLPFLAVPVLMLMMILALALIFGDIDEILPYMNWSLSLAGTAEFAINVLALLGGAHLGVLLERSTSPYRRLLFALFAGMACLIPVVGFIVIMTGMIMSRGHSGGIFNLVVLAPIGIMAVWGLVLLARRVYRTYA